MRSAFAAFVVVWCTQLYLKGRASERAVVAGSGGGESKEDSPEEEDLFSDENYPIKDQYGFTDGAFKMVLSAVTHIYIHCF